MDIDATGFDETGHVDEFLFGGDGNPKVHSFAVSLAVAIGDKRTGRHEASARSKEHTKRTNRQERGHLQNKRKHVLEAETLETICQFFGHKQRTVIAHDTSMRKRKRPEHLHKWPQICGTHPRAKGPSQASQDVGHTGNARIRQFTQTNVQTHPGTNALICAFCAMWNRDEQQKASLILAACGTTNAGSPPPRSRGHLFDSGTVRSSVEELRDNHIVGSTR